MTTVQEAQIRRVNDKRCKVPKVQRRMSVDDGRAQPTAWCQDSQDVLIQGLTVRDNHSSPYWKNQALSTSTRDDERQDLRAIEGIWNQMSNMTGNRIARHFPILVYVAYDRL